jgi:hypothetical protein
MKMAPACTSIHRGGWTMRNSIFPGDITWRWGGADMPSYGFGFNPNHLNELIGEKVGGYGAQLRKDVRKFYVCSRYFRKRRMPSARRQLL